MAIRLKVTGLLGPDAMAEDKLVQALLRNNNIDFIGYNLCLRTQFVTIAKHNLLKALYAFGTADVSPGAFLPVKTLQRLASLGSRYGGICRLMRPFVRVLYAAYTGRQPQALVPLDDLTRRVITLFKVLLVMTSAFPTRFATPFAAFTVYQPCWVCEFDASLEGIGIIWYHRRADGLECPVAYTDVDITPLGFTNRSQLQNTAEYLAGFFAALGLAIMGKAHLPSLFRGDSMSALTWIEKGSVRSDTAIKAAMLWAQAAVQCRMVVTGTSFISGLDNYKTDRLSRHGSWAEVVQLDAEKQGGESRLPPNLPRLEVHPTPILEICNPAVSIEKESAFMAFLCKASRLISNLSNPDQSSPQPHL